MSSNLKRFYILTIILLALTFLVGSVTMVSAKEKELRISYPDDPKTADCQKNTAYYMLPLNCFDRLIECITLESGASDLVPGLAESWEVTPDGKTYTFHLRRGVYFHNGEELTADDVVYTFDRMLDPKTQALNTDILNFVDGAQDRLDGKTDTTKGLKALDKYTVQITLSQPFAPFLSVMASPQASIFNRKFTEKAGDQFGLTAKTTCGTGPFIMKEYVLNDHVTLVANDKYYRGRPELDRIFVRVVTDPETMRMLFEAGEIDIFDCDYAFSQIPYFLENPKWKDRVVSGPRVGIYYMCINQKKEPFGDVRVRKALQMAIDRKMILDTLFYGRGTLAHGVMPKGLIGYNPDLEPIVYDPIKAKELLAEAGYPDGVDMTLVQVSTWGQTWAKMNELVQAMVKEAGFRVKISQVDESTYYAVRKTGDSDHYMQVWSADFNDPDNFFYTFFSKSGTVVRSFNNNDPEVFEALDRARTITDQKKRIALYRELEKKIVHDQAAWVPFFNIEHLYVLAPRVKKFVVPWNGWSDMSYYETNVE